MKNSWLKKGLAVGIIGLFIGTGVGAAIAEPPSPSPQPLDRGNWLYVGGSGPGNYTKIQDAIDNASDGDTVFVYDDSSPYYENNIIIDKRITLVGENRETTIIDGKRAGWCIIWIKSDFVNISGFTFQNHGRGIYMYGRLFESKYPIAIMMNKFINCITGVSCSGSHGAHDILLYNITISMNAFIIDDTFYWFGACGIHIQEAVNCTISNNTINMLTPTVPDPEGFQAKRAGINFWFAKNFTVYGNSITNCYYAIRGVDSNNTITEFNNITNCIYGIFFEESLEYAKIRMSMIRSDINALRFNAVKKNNFQQVRFPGRSLFVSLTRPGSIFTIWEGNYWNRPRLLPKPIIGFYKIIGNFGLPIKLDFDRTPAQKPYDIPKIAI